MHDKKMQIIGELMEELQEMMAYGEDDLAERLGRKKPKVEVAMIEGEMKDPALEEAEEKVGMDLDGDDEMGEDAEHQMLVKGEDEEEEGPEASLKNRLMKLRGA